MKNLVYFLERFQRRSLLIAVAVFLVIITLLRWVGDAYETRQEEFENKMAKLGQYQLITSKAEVFDKRQKNLLRLKGQVGRYFFTGENDDKISSAMQLLIQALVAKAGMQAESIRSTVQKVDGRQEKGAETVFGEVLLKASLAGTLEEFNGFLADLYRGKEFFAIESITLKPFRNTGLKIFIELKGYYVLRGQDGDAGEDAN